MTFLNQQNKMQSSFYAQMAHDTLKIGSMSSTKIILRHIKSIHESSTEILNELGTTDMIIGDATAETMMTTLGKIPNEMYYPEDTVASGKVTPLNIELHTILDTNHTTLAPIETIMSNGYTERSTLLLILLIALLIILLICCITACIIARSRSRHAFFAKRDTECSPECSGINQPLLGLDKTSGTTVTTSGSSVNN